jgi:hypothetical protein
LQKRVANPLNNSLFDKRVWEDSLNKAAYVTDILKRLKDSLAFDELALKELEKKLPEKDINVYDSLLCTDIKYRQAYKEYLAKLSEIRERTNKLDSLKKLNDDYEKLKETYEDLKNAGAFDSEKLLATTNLPEKYKSHPMLSRAEKFMLSIRSFSMGTINPPSSLPYMQGTAINGVSVENGYGRVYTFLQAGLLEQNLDFGLLKQNVQKKYIYTVKAGYGMPENGHLHFGVTKSGKVGNAPQQTETTIVTPGNITIWSLDGKLPIHQNFSLFGNYALAHVQDFGIQPPLNENTAVNTIKAEQLLQMPNSYYTIGASGDIKATKTKIQAQSTRVGSSFYSPLNPYLRNDILKNEVRLGQKLYKEFISATLNYATSDDNLLNQKQYTTRITNYKAGINIRFKKLPSLSASYAIINQNISNAERAFSYNNKVAVYTLTAIYVKRIKTNTLTSCITYIGQQMSNSSFAASNRQYNNYTANINFSNAKGNSITATSGFATLQSETYKSLVINNQLEATYNYPKNNAFVTTAGLQYTFDDLLGNNGGVYVGQTFSFWKKNKIALSLRQNFYKGAYENSKTNYQSIVNIQLIQQW